jgi:hypothetical protein
MKNRTIRKFKALPSPPAGGGNVLDAATPMTDNLADLGATFAKKFGYIVQGAYDVCSMEIASLQSGRKQERLESSQKSPKWQETLPTPPSNNRPTCSEDSTSSQTYNHPSC